MRSGPILAADHARETIGQSSRAAGERAARPFWIVTIATRSTANPQVVHVVVLCRAGDARAGQTQAAQKVARPDDPQDHRPPARGRRARGRSGSALVARPARRAGRRGAGAHRRARLRGTCLERGRPSARRTQGPRRRSAGEAVARDAATGRREADRRAHRPAPWMGGVAGRPHRVGEARRAHASGAAA